MRRTNVHATRAIEILLVIWKTLFHTQEREIAINISCIIILIIIVVVIVIRWAFDKRWYIRLSIPSTVCCSNHWEHHSCIKIAMIRRGIHLKLLRLIQRQ